MRIIHIQDYYTANFGYQETFIMKIQSLAGHEVHMITSNVIPNKILNYKPYSKDSIFSSNFEPLFVPNNIFFHRLANNYRLLNYTHRLWLSDLERVVESLKPDLVHVHGMQSITSYRIARHAIVKPRFFKLIFDSHAAEFNSNRLFSGLFYRFYRRHLSHLYIDASDSIIAIDKWSKQFLINRCGISDKHISIIPLGADHQLFKYSDVYRNEVRKSLKISEHDPVFIYTGKISADKGTHLLIKAMSILDQLLPSSILLILGSGDQSYIELLKSYIFHLKNCKVFIYPMVHNTVLPRFYSAADISIWPLQISIGTFEAQSCGLPLIVANTPELLDRISDGNGISYVAGNFYDLADKMAWLFKNVEIRTSMSGAGRAAIENRYNWQSITNQFMSSVGLSL